MVRSNPGNLEDQYIWKVEISGILTEVPDKLYRKLQNAMFMQVWRERPHKCYIADTPLIDPRNFMFHHILEKRNYERYSLCRWNIIVLSWPIHNMYETKSDTVPELVTMRDDLISKLDSGDYDYDNEAIFPKQMDECSNLYTLFGPKFINADG